MNSSVYRTWPINKEKPWIYYQEWNEALFLHWEIPFDVLRPLIPQDLEIDNFKGKCWVSLVAFTMNKIRPRFLPQISYVSNFHELNLRTYVSKDGKPGVFFLSIEGEKTLSNFIAKKLSGLPYEKSNIQYSSNHFINKNSKTTNFLEAQFNIKEKIDNKTEIDIWLTERYCLYLSEKSKTYIYEIDHSEWSLCKVDFTQLHLKYQINSHFLNSKPDLCHYSSGVQVRAWSREKTKG